MKVSSALLGIALTAVSGVAFHLWRDLEAGRQQVAVLSSKSQERQPPTPEQTSIVAGQPLQPSTESQPSERSDSSALIAEHREALEAVLKQLASPEGKAASKSRMRLNQASAHPDVDQALGLTTEEADKLLDLLTMQRARSMETVVVQPESAQDSEARLRKQGETEEAELQTLLGSKYPKWQDYRENRYAWEQRSDLRTVLDAAGFPLTQTQEGALISALSAEQRSINQGNPKDFSQYTPENRQRLLDAAAPHLSPQQLDGYKGLLERNASREQAARKLLESSVFH
jgi:hypothetical protein